MRRCESVSIPIGNLIGSGLREHRDIIRKYSQNGFRYVGYVPTELKEHEHILELDLIFEKEDERPLFI